eukprot:COSAG01_NODE_1568_length_9874_cov_15.549872_5_plen_114_part_00
MAKSGCVRREVVGCPIAIMVSAYCMVGGGQASPRVMQRRLGVCVRARSPVLVQYSCSMQSEECKNIDFRHSKGAFIFTTTSTFLLSSHSASNDCCCVVLRTEGCRPRRRRPAC